MSAKTSPARRAAFFKALGETGNYAIAAAHAKVSRSWVTLHKTNDPAFRAACAAAIAGAAARAAAGGSAKPSAKWGYSDGEELVVRAGNGRRAVIARARLRQWTARSEARFLEALAATCNVKAACAAAGLSVASAYNRRKKWRAFAEQWGVALETGYVRLELALVENACNTLAGEPVAHDNPMPPVTVRDAIHLLYLHRSEVRGIGRAPGRVARLPDIETVRAQVLHLVGVFERAKAHSRPERAEK